MKTEIKEVYKCEYCNKLYQRKHAAIQHENGCSKNPNNKRACIVDGIACDHLIKKRVWHYFDTPFGEDKQQVDLLYCGHKKIFMYPPKVEAKKNWFELGDELNEPMPKECDDYKLLDYDMCLMHPRS